MEYIHLIGAEQVERASYTFRSAVESFERSVASLENSIYSLVQALEQHAVAIQPVEAVEEQVEVERRVYRDTDEFRSYMKARTEHLHGNWFRGANEPFFWEGHMWAYRYTSFNDKGKYDVIYRRTK